MDDAEHELLRVAHEWDRAMVANDAGAIASFMADDWIIIGPDGNIGTRETFREVERSSSVFVRQDGRWRCVLTHFSRLGEGKHHGP